MPVSRANADIPLSFASIRRIKDSLNSCEYAIASPPSTPNKVSISRGDNYPDSGGLPGF